MMAKLERQYALDQSLAASSGQLVAEQRMATVLNALGWQSASDIPAAEVAELLALIVERGLSARQEFTRLVSAVADCLRTHAHALDGGQGAAADWIPMATSVLAKYATGDRSPMTHDIRDH